jgi:two-component system response regulator MprA
MIVVDDDPKVRQLLERAFRPPEFETHSFPTGMAALTSLTQIKPDCVVSDILMPDMDGESLLRALRAVPGLESVPFIALSAVRSEARIRAVIGAGADAFLLKPFPLRELTEKVRSLVERPHAARAARLPLGEDMQPTRPVMRASHTMSTTSLRHRGLVPQAPPVETAIPEPPDEPAHPPIPEPEPISDAEPIAASVSAAPAPPPPAPAVEPPPQVSPEAPVVRMAGPVRVVPASKPASEPATAGTPGTRPLRPVRLPGGVHDEAEVRRIELSPQAGLGFGRFTRVEGRGRSFVIMTEAVQKPKFTVTTVITEKGVPLRKIESALPHPLAREEDIETVRRQLDLQHDEIVKRLDDYVLDGGRRRVVWSDQSRTIDAALLAWTLSAVAQLAEAEVGTEETARALYLTRERALVAEDSIRAFQITSGARVVVEPGQGSHLPRRAVRAVAGWCHDFATSALLVDADQVAEPVRQATRLHGDELERIGFYDRLRRRARS